MANFRFHKISKTKKIRHICKIYKNNTLVNGFVFDPFSNQTTWATNVLCGILQCAANDTVRIYCAGAGYPDNADWTSWSMYLLG